MTKLLQTGIGSVALGRLQLALGRPSPVALPPTSVGYGPLIPKIDPNTGIKLLRLPRDFRYHSVNWAGDTMEDGAPTPPLPDGMGCFALSDGNLALLRNHEISDTGFIFSGAAPCYDPGAGGGVTRLVVDPETGSLIRTEAALTGTLRNCSGGATPWGSWITCEETLAGLGDLRGLRKSHGYAFEVPAEETASAEPLLAMGRRFHEAAAVTHTQDAVYLTEDRNLSGLYRFRPKVPGKLASGGPLEMLAIRGEPQKNLTQRVPVGPKFSVDWVPIEDPSRPHSRDNPGDTLGCFSQGHQAGGAIFARLEGCFATPTHILFTSTSGGPIRAGQVWSLDLKEQTLEVLWQAENRKRMTNPDNLVVSPRGGVLFCEDGWGRPQRLQILRPNGIVAPFAENACVLSGERHHRQGDFRQSEFAGACFSPDGTWLFVNLQAPGITVAITGPWERGTL